jgi:hypothetical protein
MAADSASLMLAMAGISASPVTTLSIWPKTARQSMANKTELGELPS